MRKVLDRLTGAQITVIAVAAIAAMVPGSLYAVAAFTNVAIQDPVMGYRAQVDQQGKVQVGPSSAVQFFRDAFDYYKHNPLYKFRVLFSADSNHVIYTAPSGYYAIIETLTGINTTANGGGFYLLTSSGYLTGIFGGPVASVSQSFGSGAVLYPGETVSVDSRGAGNTGLFLHGYLVPTNISLNQTALEQQQPAIQRYVNSLTKGLPKTKESPH